MQGIIVTSSRAVLAAIFVGLLTLWGCVEQDSSMLGDDPTLGYTDEQIVERAGGMIDTPIDPAPEVTQYPVHTLMSSGQRMPLWEVTKFLDLDRSKLADGIAWLKGRDVVVAFRASPSYDLVYLSDFVVDDRPFDDEDRMTHGVRFVPHRRYEHAESATLRELYARVYGIDLPQSTAPAVTAEP